MEQPTTTTLRPYGDERHIVLHTENNALYRRLSKWNACQRCQEYEAFPPGMSDIADAKVVAVDLFFRKGQESRVRREAGLEPKQKRQRTAAQIATADRLKERSIARRN